MSVAARSTVPRTDRWSAGDAVRISGVPHRTIDYWARIGLVVPVVEASGAGSDRWYSLTDLTVLMTVVELNKHGAKLPLRRLIVTAIRREWDTDFIHIQVTPLVEIIVHIAEIRRKLRRALNLTR